MINHYLTILAIVVVAAIIVAIAYEIYANHSAIEHYETLLAGYEDEFDVHMAALSAKVEPVIRAADPIVVAVQDNAGNVAAAAVTAISSVEAAPVQVQTADVAGVQPAAAPVQVQ